MPDLSELDSYFNSQYRPETHYLADLNKEPETWQEEQQGSRRTY